MQLSTKICTVRGALILSVAAVFAPPSAAPAEVEWIRQVGTTENDSGWGVSADGLGSIYVSGSTFGSLAAPNAGESDMFMRKYDATGNVLWSRQLGTSGSEDRSRVSTDGLGNVYVAGRTSGNLAGGAGGYDMYLARYDELGNLIWTRQYGTSSFDQAMDVSADALGNIYVSGSTDGSLGGPNSGGTDGFVAKYNASGGFLWSRQIGTAGSDSAWRLSTDTLGNVYVGGETGGSLGGPSSGGNDAFLGKYDAGGNLHWIRQFGDAGRDIVLGVSTDHLGNAYVSGETEGSIDDGDDGPYDVFLRKYDAAGDVLWTQQLLTGAEGQFNAVSADGLGNAYLSGSTSLNLGGPNAGGHDVFVSKYDGAGSLLGTSQIGSENFDWIRGVSADGLGNVYISGTTRGDLGGIHAGGVQDAFLAKFSESAPEPSTLLLAALVFVPFAWRPERIRSRVFAASSRIQWDVSSARVRRNTVAPVVVAALLGATSAQAAVITGPVTNPSNGNRYYLLTQNNWTGSEAEAVGLGGHLVTINDAAEDAWVAATFANFGNVPRALWIGLNDVAVEGSFVWVSGQPLAYVNWALDSNPPEPNDNLGKEDWAHIFPPTDDRYPKWNDAPDEANAFGFVTNGVVEVGAVPEPSTLLLSALAIAALARHHRRAPPQLRQISRKLP